MIVIAILLGLSAVYCGGAWLWLCSIGIRHRAVLTQDQQIEMERQTFHLGLCFILAIGLLGLVWK